MRPFAVASSTWMCVRVDGVTTSICVRLLLIAWSQRRSGCQHCSCVLVREFFYVASLPASSWALESVEYELGCSEEVNASSGLLSSLRLLEELVMKFKTVFLKTVVIGVFVIMVQGEGGSKYKPGLFLQSTINIQPGLFWLHVDTQYCYS